MEKVLEKYLIIYHDISNGWETAPELLEKEKDKPVLTNTFFEAERKIKEDIEYWKRNRPDINNVKIENNGYIWKASDTYGSCTYYIRKIFIDS
jgi:hypothetical protein